MKKTRLKVLLLAVIFSVFLTLGLTACGNKNKDSGNERTQLSLPKNVELILNLNKSLETEFILEWDKVENASSYKVMVGGETFMATRNRFDITGKVVVGRKNSIDVWAVGAREKYKSSEPTTLVCTPKLISSNIKLKSISGGYEVGRKTLSSAADLVLPDRYCGEPIIKIADYGFGRCGDDGVFNSSYVAKYNSVQFPKKLKTIGKKAFAFAELDRINLPSSVKIIEEGCFYNCTINSVNLSMVEAIESRAFFGCNLTEIAVPASVKKIGDEAFCSNSNLKNVVFDGKSQLLECGKMVFAGCRSMSAIPQGLTIIGEGMFSFCNMFVDVVVSSSVKFIGKMAFEECLSMKSLFIPASVVQMEGGVFEGIPDDAKISISNDNSAYVQEKGCIFSRDGKELFKYFSNNLESKYVVPNDVERIAPYAFCNATYLINIELSSNLKSIGDYAFYRTSLLTQITLPYGLQAIGQSAFEDSGLTRITIPDSVTLFGQSAFSADKLKEIKLPSSITKLCAGAFYKSSFEYIEVPDSVKIIESWAFALCGNLKYVILPKTLTSVCKNENEMMFYLLDLSQHIIPKIYFKGTPAEWSKMNEEGVFGKNAFRLSLTDDETAPIYFYSEFEPTNKLNKYWHYDENGNAVEWFGDYVLTR